MSLETWSVTLLALYSAIAFVDGVVIHLVLLRLHERDETRHEHTLHTARAVLFALGLPLLFIYETGGALLWLGAALIAVDFGFGFWDAWVERDARAELGGLGRAEYLVHVGASVVHGAMVALILASRPLGAWSLDAAAGWGTLSTHGAFVAQWLAPGSFVLALAHVALLHPQVRALTMRVPRCCAQVQ